MKNGLCRKNDPIATSFLKSDRILTNERGFFYKIRGGKVNGPFATIDDAREDLSTFIRVLKIEAELDPKNFQISS